MSKSERVRLQLLFGLFGIGLMALAPRSPDLKHNLHVSNGLYGLLVSLGALGSVVALLYIGRLVQRVGVRRTLYISTTFLYILMGSVPHIHNPWIYAGTNVFIALAFSSHNIALHTQTLQRQDESGEMLLPRMHGTWSIGALITVIAALGLTSRISFAVHIDILMALIWVLTIGLIRSSHSTITVGSNDPISMERVNLHRIKQIFTFDKSIIVAYALGGFIEFASGDWSTLVTNQEIHASKSTSVLSYLALIFAMIVGRMYFVRLIGYRSERFWIRLASLVGGGGFILFSQLGWFFAGKGYFLAVPVEVLSFFLAGLGTSFMAPLFTTIANRRSPLKPSEVVAQLNLSNTVAIFGAKLIVSWIAQVTSITIALLVPGIALLFVSRFAYLGNPNRLVTPKS